MIIANAALYSLPLKCLVQSLGCHGDSTPLAALATALTHIFLERRVGVCCSFATDRPMTYLACSQLAGSTSFLKAREVYTAQSNGGGGGNWWTSDPTLDLTHIHCNVVYLLFCSTLQTHS